MLWLNSACKCRRVIAGIKRMKKYHKKCSILTTTLVDSNKFNKNFVYYNEIFNRLARLCSKYDNRKKLGGSFHYTHYQYAFDALH